MVIKPGVQRVGWIKNSNYCKTFTFSEFIKLSYMLVSTNYIDWNYPELSSYPVKPNHCLPLQQSDKFFFYSPISLIPYVDPHYYSFSPEGTYNVCPSHTILNYYTAEYQIDNANATNFTIFALDQPPNSIATHLYLSINAKCAKPNREAISLMRPRN